MPLSGGTINGNMTVLGTMNVGGLGVQYTGVGPGHSIAWGWDGAYLQAYVDANYIGDFAPRSGRDAPADAVSGLKAEIAALAARLRALEERL